MKLSFLVLLSLADANAQPGGIDPANVGLLRTIAPVGGELFGLAFSKDGRRLVVGCGQTVRMYNTGGWREERRLGDHPESILSVAIRPDGKQVAAGGFRGTLIVWDAETGELVRTIKAHTSYVSTLAWSPDGRHLVSGSHDGFARIWSADGTERARLKPGPGRMTAVAFSPDGSLVATAVSAGNVKIWTAKDWKEERALTGTAGSTAVIFTRDGARVLTAGHGKVSFWNVRGEAKSRSLDYPYGVNVVALTPDGAHVVLGGMEGKVRLWDARSGKKGAELSHHTATVTGVAVHRGGRLIASIGQDRHVKVWGPMAGGMANVPPKGFCGIRVQQGVAGGVEITEVIAGTAAARAGLRKGDLIRKVDGIPVKSPTESIDLISSHLVGEEVKFEFDRGGVRKTIGIKLGKRPALLK